MESNRDISRRRLRIFRIGSDASMICMSIWIAMGVMAPSYILFWFSQYQIFHGRILLKNEIRNAGGVNL